MSAVVYESHNHIAVITINRPDKRNAINTEVVHGLHAAWQRFAASEERVAVITGAGDQAFSAGADTNDLPTSIWLAMPNLAVECAKPIIAAVSGYAVGAGATLIMLADMVVATEDAQFVYPEAKLGAFAGLMGSFPTRLPYKQGLQWILTGDPMTAQRAYEIGLVNEVCASGEHLTSAMQLAGKIAENAPLVVQAMKRLALDTLPDNPVASYYRQKHMLDGIAQSVDLQEGLAAMRGKRNPNFRGR